MRLIFWILGLLSFLSLVGFIFWTQEVQYLLPTPKPDGVKKLNYGEKAPVEVLGLNINTDKNLLIHFYNPNCPCTKFNLKEIKLLSFEYKNDIDLVVVAQTDRFYDGLKDKIKHQFLQPVRVVFDKNGNIARAFGVYTSPQMVLVDKNLSVVYSGNYNISRYCTAKKTAFGKQSIEYLVDGSVIENSTFLNTKQSAYGCLLPSYND